MADLRVEDAILTQARSALHTASGRLDPVGQAMKALDATVVGADPLVQSLSDAHRALMIEVAILAQGVAELHDHIGDAGAVFGNVDQVLARDAGTDAR